MFIIGCKKIEFQNSIPLQILHHSLLYLSYSFFSICEKYYVNTINFKCPTWSFDEKKGYSTFSF